MPLHSCARVHALRATLSSHLIFESEVQVHIRCRLSHLRSARPWASRRPVFQIKWRERDYDQCRCPEAAGIGL